MNVLEILKKRETNWKECAETMLAHREWISNEEFLKLMPAIHSNLIRADECRQIMEDIKK